MSLRNSLERQGDLFFRFRSFLPLILLPVLIAALPAAAELEALIGDNVEDLWRLACLVLSLLGLLLRVLTVGFAPPGTSGRNTREQRADHLNTSGIYSAVRHPLYLANFVIFAGFILSVPVWWFVLICCLSYMVYYERIMMAEERFLRDFYSVRYDEWAATTPAIIPNFSRWRPSERPFSWRKVLRQEFHALFLIAAVFLVIELFTDTALLHEPLDAWFLEDWFWTAQFALGATIFLGLRFVKRHTRWLN